MRTLRSLLGLFIVGVIIYCAWTLLPVYITNYQLEDAMDSAARFGAVDSRKTEREIRESVLHEAQALQVEHYSRADSSSAHRQRRPGLG